MNNEREELWKVDRRERRQTVSVYDLVKLAEELGYTPDVYKRQVFIVIE